MNKISTFIKTSLFGLVAMLGLSVSAASASVLEMPTEAPQEISLWDAYVDNSAKLLASVENPFGIDTRIKTDAASEDDLQTSVIKIINYLFLFLGLALLVIIIYSGVKIIFSDGDEEAVTGARTTIMYAILGVAVIVLSYTLVDFIANVATGGGVE